MTALYTAENFQSLLGLPGFSDTLLTNHFALYEGYVKNTNTLIGLLESTEPGTPALSELHRRFGWEWNGMRLHELYFGNMTKETTELTAGTLREKIETTYGSVEKWQKDFLTVGAMRGIGWVVFYHDREKDKLFTAWINEHDGGHLAGAVPLLVMDVFEHAFMADYGIKRADYLTAFIRAVDWSVVEKRFSA